MEYEGNPLRRSPETAPRRVEVSRVVTDEGSYVLLQDLHYGPGVGWYAQKTIRLDPEQVDALMRELCCARSTSQPRTLSQRDGGCRCGESARPASTEKLATPVNLHERRQVSGAEIIAFPSSLED